MGKWNGDGEARAVHGVREALGGDVGRAAARLRFTDEHRSFLDHVAGLFQIAVVHGAFNAPRARDDFVLAFGPVDRLAGIRDEERKEPP